jgi:transcriptional regulator with XRE-family HTH domain
VTCGEKIKAARKAQGRSQLELALKAGTWPSQLCRYEMNEYAIKVDTLMRIAAALGVEAASLLPDPS